MSKVAVVYWSGTGNTAAMAAYIEQGAKEAGADVLVAGSAVFGAKDRSEAVRLIRGE